MSLLMCALAHQDDTLVFDDMSTPKEERRKDKKKRTPFTYELEEARACPC